MLLFEFSLQLMIFIRDRFVFILLFINNDGVGVVFDGLIVSTHESLCVGFGKVMLYHVIIAIL